MADIVILTARFGNGHLNAARNIRQALAGSWPGLSVELIDPFEETLRGYRSLQRLYRFALLNVVTDSVTVNRSGLRGEVDLHLVADPLTEAVLDKDHIPRGRVVVTGFPVHPHFAARARAPREPRQEDGRLNVLYLPNLGTRYLYPILEILSRCPGVRVTLALGKDERQVRKVSRFVRGLAGSFDVRGWIPDIALRMLESDLVITKAGGATVHEAIAAGCPLIISQVTPGQEEGNARLVEALGMGMAVRNEKGLRRLVDFFSRVDFQVLSDMRRRMERFRIVDGAFRIADLAGALATAADLPI